MIKGATFSRSVLFELLRYGAVGLAVNFVGYLVYLLATVWLEPKRAVTALYPIGVLIAYFAHARYSFSYTSGRAWALVRYLMAQVAGYGANITLLHVFTDLLGYPHQAVQAVAIFVVAGLLFLSLKFFVFPQSHDPDEPRPNMDRREGLTGDR